MASARLQHIVERGSKYGKKISMMSAEDLRNYKGAPKYEQKIKKEMQKRGI